MSTHAKTPAKELHPCPFTWCTNCSWEADLHHKPHSPAYYRMHQRIEGLIELAVLETWTPETHSFDKPLFEVVNGCDAVGPSMAREAAENLTNLAAVVEEVQA